MVFISPLSSLLRRRDRGVHETLTEYMLRSEALDRRDAWIESNYQSNVVGGKEPVNRGFAMSKASIALITQTPNNFTGFSSDVASMVDEAEK